MPCTTTREEVRPPGWGRDGPAQDGAAYPLSDLSLVPKRHQVDVRLQRAGVDHGLVPGTGPALSAPASPSTTEEEAALTSVC